MPARSGSNLARALVLGLTLAAGSPACASPAAQPPRAAASPAVFGPIAQQKVVALTRQAEDSPLAPNAQALRAALMKYFIEAPDIEITAHGDLLGDLGKMPQEESAIIVGQMMFAMGAYLIEHPAAKTNDLEVQVAGVEGALRVYANLKKARAGLSIADLEKLVQLRARDGLAAHIRTLLENRSKEKK